MRHVVEVQAFSADDPTGTRSAAILAAYFRLEQAQVFCRLLWRRLAALAVGWVAFASLLIRLSGAALGLGLGIIAAGGVCATIMEWRAMRTLQRALTKDRSRFL